MTEVIRMTCTEAASAYRAARSAAAKREVRAYIEARVKESKRARWGRLLKAIDAKDAKRIAYYAATGDERIKALEAVKAADAKAKAKPAKAPAKRTRKAAPKAQPKADAIEPDLAAMADELGIDASKLVAFVTLLRD